ncbi:DUF3592 domain-containing protein [Kineococcus sp. SYSU DK003]|uniref:DUF3592 domain-containing protein n=1 Tax=Kineococcus sp. SYSU DK003 TaxID=3383124 RepID=UPI003D7EB636
MEPRLPAFDSGLEDAGGVPTFFVVLLVLVALVGLAVVAGGVRTVVRSRSRAREAARLSTEGVTTTGTVVDNRITSRHERRMTFSPVVRFVADGREVTVVGEQVWNRSFVTGRSARVVYDPRVPERAHVRAEGGSVFGAGTSGVFLTVFGVAFLVLVGVMADLVASVF